MRPDSVFRRHLARVRNTAWALSLIAGFFFNAPAFAQMTTDQWRESMWTIPLPQNGCFQSSYPSLSWQTAVCTTAPLHPQVPMHGGPMKADGSYSWPGGGRR
jgi:hypothetical protein